MILKSTLLAAAILAAVSAPVLAQTTAPKPRVPAPQADPGIVTPPHTGVVPAPKTDPGMTVPAPQNGKGTVIPPPGTPGNTPAVIPK
jgi:hypothetical protein